MSTPRTWPRFAGCPVTLPASPWSRGPVVLDRDGADPAADGVSYRQGMLWLSPDELAEMTRKMLGVLRDSVANKPTAGRAPYLLSPILFPTAEPLPAETRQEPTSTTAPTRGPRICDSAQTFQQ